MPHTRYIEQARQFLATSLEYPTDHLISYFVQTNELSRRICDIFAYDDLDHTEIRDEFVSTVTVQAFSRELNGLKRSLLPELQQNRTWSRLSLAIISYLPLFSRITIGVSPP